mmetsp:Transcript_33652/g.85020  ORF Transcript_33652/g.85020 Transcript_33652/m.85020 type:complete len:211 (+) Transcript_33652:310-942(+)
MEPIKPAKAAAGLLQSRSSSSVRCANSLLRVRSVPAETEVCLPDCNDESPCWPGAEGVHSPAKLVGRRRGVAAFLSGASSFRKSDDLAELGARGMNCPAGASGRSLELPAFLGTWRPRLVKIAESFGASRCPSDIHWAGEVLLSPRSSSLRCAPGCIAAKSNSGVVVMCICPNWPMRKFRFRAPGWLPPGGETGLDPGAAAVLSAAWGGT